MTPDGARKLVAVAIIGLVVGLMVSHRWAPESRRVEADHSAWVGCVEVTQGPTCSVARSSTISVLVGNAEGVRSVRHANLAEWRVVSTPRGPRVDVRFDESRIRKANLVVVASTRDGAEAHLNLAVVEHDPIHPSLGLAADARARGALKEARRLAWPLLEHESPAMRGSARAFLARLDLQMGAVDEAWRGLDRAVDELDAAGRISAAADARLVLAYLHNLRHRFGQALSRLDEAESVRSVYPEVLPFATLQRAEIEMEVGDTRRALSLLRRTRALATAWGIGRLDRQALDMQVHLLQRIGRVEAAEPLLAELALRVPKEGSCRIAAAVGNLGEYTNVAGDHEAAREYLRRALSMYESSCADPKSHALYVTVLAGVELSLGALDDAEALLALAERLRPRPDPWAAASLLRHRAALHERREQRSRAIKTYRALAGLGDDGSRPLDVIRGLLGEARQWRKMKNSARALIMLRDAERRLDVQALRVPLGEGRGAFIDMQSEVVDTQLELLSGIGRFREAAEVARRSHARLIRQVAVVSQVGWLNPDARRDWATAVERYREKQTELGRRQSAEWQFDARELKARQAARLARAASAERALEAALDRVVRRQHPSPRLAAPGAGELFVVLHETENAVLVFPWTPRGVGRVLRRAPPVDGDVARWFEVLLPDLDGEISEATRVVFYASKSLQRGRPHRTPWRGEPLVLSREVTYGLDLGRMARGAALLDLRHWLVVRDEATDLPFVDDEVRLVRDAATRAHVGLRECCSPAPLSSLPSVLASVDLLHYAGHAHRGSADGWWAKLGSSDGALTTGGILSASGSPLVAVLSGCRTIGDDAGAHVERLGLAQAFALAGAQVVVGTDRDVEDGAALAMSDALYASFARVRAEGGDAVAWFTEAQRSLSVSQPELDWAAFRVFVP